MFAAWLDLESVVATEPWIIPLLQAIKSNSKSPVDLVKWLTLLLDRLWGHQDGLVEI